MAFLTMFLVLISVIGGALSYKANTSLPGEPLYLYKLQVNERIEGLVAHTNDAKARWNLMMLQERLAEARHLAKHGHLDSAAQAEVTENIQIYVKNLTILVTSLQASGAYQEASQLASTLYRTLNTEAQMVADVSSLGSANLQISLAPVLTRLRTMTATVSLISIKAYAKAADVETTPVENPAIITAPTESVIEVKREDTPVKEKEKYFK